MMSTITYLQISSQGGNLLKLYLEFEPVYKKPTRLEDVNQSVLQGQLDEAFKKVRVGLCFGVFLFTDYNLFYSWICVNARFGQ